MGIDMVLIIPVRKIVITTESDILLVILITWCFLLTYVVDGKTGHCRDKKFKVSLCKFFNLTDYF